MSYRDTGPLPESQSPSSEVEEAIRREMQAARLAAAPPPRPPSFLERTKAQGGVLGGIASILLALLKIGAPLLAFLSKFKFLAFILKSKVLLTVGTMFLSIWLEAKIFGWPFAVGIVFSLLIHECGHAVAGYLVGRPFSGMIFIPFMGAAVFRKMGGRNVAEDAFVAIAGPVAGALGGLAFLAVWFFTGAPILLALASFGFFINLLNLLPTLPLDGGWIVPVFSPRLLAVGLVLMVVTMVVMQFINPFLWVMVILSIPRVIAGWKANTDSPYFKASPRDRWVYGIAYLALAGFLAAGHLWAHQVGQSHRPKAPAQVALITRATHR